MVTPRNLSTSRLLIQENLADFRPDLPAEVIEHHVERAIAGVLAEPEVVRVPAAELPAEAYLP